MEYMANDPRNDVVINPAYFFVPDDVIDVRSGTAESYPDIDSEPAEFEFDLAEVLDSELDGSNPDSIATLQTPQWLTIVDQQVRVAPDGRSVVDVYFECEDVPGAIDYQLRVAK